MNTANLFKINTLSLLAFTLLGFSNCADNNNVKSWQKEDKLVNINTKDGKLKLCPLNDNSVRVIFQKKEEPIVADLIYLDNISAPKFNVSENDSQIVVYLPKLTAKVNKSDACINYYTENDELILSELGRSVVDDSVQNLTTYQSRQSFYSPEDEYLYGLGQFQDGNLNVRGLSRRLTQVNTQISIPFVISNKGYALLWNNCGLTDFNPADSCICLDRVSENGETEEVNVTSTEGGKKEIRQSNNFEAQLNITEKGEYSILLDVGNKMARRHNLEIDNEKVVDIFNVWLPPTTSTIVSLSEGNHSLKASLTSEDKPKVFYRKVDNSTTFSSPVSNGVDYTVFAGSADEAIASYRAVSGKTPLLPKWAFGYIHCRERFHSQDEIINTAKRFQKEQLPVDVIVQDWQYWGKYGWNAMKFDEQFYPNPKTLVDELHKMNLRFMLSVWAKVDENSEVGRMAKDSSYYIPNTTWIDFFNQKASDYYWNNFSDRLLKPYNIDAWWQDATEPENDDLEGRLIGENSEPGEIYRNAFPFFVNKTVYSGLRKDDPNKRNLILTRSAFPGIQRFGVVTWSGDVGNDFTTLKNQIIGGLGYMASGMPWWTYDAGGFFRPREQYSSKEYHECFLRWLQVSVFLPLMRVHGYMTDTEFWNYGNDVVNASRKCLNLRYSLIPYIYSQASQVSKNGYTLMRPLVMDFPKDTASLKNNCQYMFGKSLMIVPILEAGATTTDVYLPENKGGWFDFYSQDKVTSGKIIVSVLPDEIPVYVRAGSIIPFAKPAQNTASIDDTKLDLIIYPGQDAEFVLYNDNGVNYDYEKGLYTEINLNWNDAKQKLVIGSCKGTYPEMKSDIKITIKIAGSSITKNIDYHGKELEIEF
ncbi:MAG: glycoside hydrolase family 31 protein [Bacteroidales bacterium]|nr:glycoside hydrolase family 31 protein [Bacteroidales bacterium]